MGKLTDEEFRDFLKTCRELAEGPFEEMQREVEVTNKFPQEFIDLARENNLYRYALPEQYGGWGFTDKEILQVQEEPYIATARALGVPRVRIAVSHMLPHVLPQYLVGLVLLFPHAVLHEASITFLGFGLSPEQPAIGVILSEAMGYLTSGAWWLAVFPGLALLAVVLMFDRAGALLRRMMSPEGVQG